METLESVRERVRSVALGASLEAERATNTAEVGGGLDSLFWQARALALWQAFFMLDGWTADQAYDRASRRVPRFTEANMMRLAAWERTVGPPVMGPLLLPPTDGVQA